MNKLISKIGEFFNTEIQPTIGGQLLWLVATVLVTQIYNLKMEVIICHFMVIQGLIIKNMLKN